MKKLRIALLQIAPAGSLEKNLEKGLAACERARALGADIALSPELWSNGYGICDRPAAEWTAGAVPGDGPFPEAFRKKAAELELDALRDYREREAFGNAYRHPRLYRELVEETVRYPFVRADARP